MKIEEKELPYTAEACNAATVAVRDALYVLSGKWKLPLMVSLINGSKRFNEIQRALEDITPKVLSKELRELELNEFVERKVFSTVPVTVTYQLTEYSKSVGQRYEAGEQSTGNGSLKAGGGRQLHKRVPVPKTPPLERVG